jgi:hypothetical protein
VSPKGRTIDEYKKRVATGGTRNFQEDQSDVFFLSEGSVRYCSAASTSYPKLPLVCDVLVNIDILTVNYNIKQNKFIKPTSEPRTNDPKKSNEVFDRAIR